MREIEYRAWNRLEQRMLSWNDAVWRDPEYPDEGTSLRQYAYKAHSLPASLIPMEFTQATDNKGVKIFEGDIVQDGNGLRFKIEYRKDLYRFVLCSLDGRRVVRSSLDAYHNIEVIGNIYDFEAAFGVSIASRLKEEGAPAPGPDKVFTCTYDRELQVTEFTWRPVFQVGDWVQPDDAGIPYFQIRAITIAGWPQRWDGALFSPAYLTAYSRGTEG